MGRNEEQGLGLWEVERWEFRLVQLFLPPFMTLGCVLCDLPPYPHQPPSLSFFLNTQSHPGSVRGRFFFFLTCHKRKMKGE